MLHREYKNKIHPKIRIIIEKFFKFKSPIIFWSVSSVVPPAEKIISKILITNKLR